jgi:hypothetical protein
MSRIPSHTVEGAPDPSRSLHPGHYGNYECYDKNVRLHYGYLGSLMYARRRGWRPISVAQAICGLGVGEGI